MSFDRIAPHYPWMERALAGAAMHRARTAFLDRLPAPRRVLLPGEGHGRFLVEVLRRFPRTVVTVLDASERMLREARTLPSRQGLSLERVEFIHADATAWEPPAAAYDLVAAHFFFDCFTAAQVDDLAARLAHGSTPDARWLVADFHTPARGPARWRARAIVWALYRFFAYTARVAAQNLAPPDRALEHHGFTLEARQLFDWQLLHSDLWVRSDPNAWAPPA